MANLVTGGSGYIGSELVRRLVDRGEETIVFDQVKSIRLDGLETKIKVVLGDLGNAAEVMNAVKDYRITAIYHMGAMLTFVSESNPWGAFQANVVGTCNVLEAARLFNVEKVMFTSSIGTFSEHTEGKLTDTTLQRPVHFYGVCKLYGEGMGRFYRRKFGLDFRSIRYPMVVGPGVTTPNHWQPALIRSAVQGKPYQCPVTEDTADALLYYKDAVRAADLIMQAPRENLQMVVYNVGGVPVTPAGELLAAVKRQIPGAEISCAATSSRPAGSSIQLWDDSWARREWGWQPLFSTPDQLVADFIKEMKSGG